MIPEHKIQEVLERTDIVTLVGRYVELKKAGRSFKGRCPFHQEKTPSFQVTPEMRRFKCFGCDAGGDAISFIQRYLGKSFVDAVKDLAKDAGIDLATAEDPAAKERQELKEATDAAAQHFRDRLWEPTVGKFARDYLHSRGVDDETAKRFNLGWAPNQWSDLADALTRLGMVEWASRAGLVAKRQKGDGYFDFFRGRLMIPIRSAEGRTIAFGGRLLEGEDGAKYFNSRESKLYNKSETLYGMDQAREEIRKKKSAILVEGYFDCIGMHQAGVRNTVALCSTALTAGHLALLTRAEAKELVLLLDGDEAGRKAVERLAGPILAAGAAAKVALLPQGEDPDTFARREGPPGVQRLLGEAQDLTRHLFSSILPEGTASTFEAKMKAVERIRPVATALPVGLTRSAFFGAMSAWFGLPASELESSLRGKPAPVAAVPKPDPARPGAPVSRGPMGQVPGVPARPLPERPPDELESAIVAAALKEPKVLAQDLYRACDELKHPGLRAVLAHLQGGHSGEDALFESSEAVRKALAEGQRQLPQEGSLEPMFVILCRKLKLRRIDEQLTHIARVTGQVASASDLDDETRRLLSERASLLSLRKKVITEGQSVTGTKPSPYPV